MSHTSTWKEGDGEFLLVISGMTRAAPFLAGWQEFKDHIRKVVKEQPGWVDVYSSQSQRRGEMQGWARLRDRRDADSAYKMYNRSKASLVVHVWETCRSSDGFRLLKCNCSARFAELSDGDHSAGQCGIDLGRLSHLTAAGRASYYDAANYQYPQARSMQVMYGYPSAPSYNTTSVYPHYAQLAQMPVYSTNTDGMPVNVQHGAILTEVRGIFIQNLNYKCTASDLHALIQTVIQPVDCCLVRDSRTNAFKGAATARFASKEHAQYAADHLNRREHMGMTLSVRMDKETTVVGQAGPPLIVGSDMYRVGAAQSC